MPSSNDLERVVRIVTEYGQLSSSAKNRLLKALANV